MSTIVPERRFLFQTDPDLFLRLLLNNDAEVRAEGLKRSFDDMLLCETLRYGICEDESMIEPLKALHEMAQMMEVGRRSEILSHVRGFIENTTMVSPNALMPFITEDKDDAIVATAVIDFASLASLTDNDPMSRPRDIVEMIKSGKLKNTSAAFKGLLLLGDARVCRLLWPLKDRLRLTEVKEATDCAGVIYSAWVDFHLEWLESMKEPADSALFGVVAFALTKQRRASSLPEVITGLRPFPFASISQEEWKIASRPVPVAEYTARIAPRLYALERAEPPPRVMPHVIEAWGLGPLSTPEETADFPP